MSRFFFAICQISRRCLTSDISPGSSNQPVTMTDFERNYFGTGPRPLPLTAAPSSSSATGSTVTGQQRKRGVLVRTSSSSRESHTTTTTAEEWQGDENSQPPPANEATTPGGGEGGGDGVKSSSLRRPVKKEVNFVSPTKSSDASSPAELNHVNSTQRQNSHQDSTLERRLKQQQLKKQQQSRARGEELLGNEKQHQYPLQSSGEGTNYTLSRIETPEDRGFAVGSGNGGSRSGGETDGGLGTGEVSRDTSDWNVAAEAISYYSESGSNSVTMIPVNNSTSSALAIDTTTTTGGRGAGGRQAALHSSSSWSLSSNWAGGVRGGREEGTNLDESRFGTIRSVQSESTNQLNRSGSMRRIKNGRSNQSLCSCDAETEVSVEF